jgi:hypothetical protein
MKHVIATLEKYLLFINIPKVVNKNKGDLA